MHRVDCRGRSAQSPHTPAAVSAAFDTVPCSRLPPARRGWASHHHLGEVGAVTLRPTADGEADAAPRGCRLQASSHQLQSGRTQVGGTPNLRHRMCA